MKISVKVLINTLLLAAAGFVAQGASAAPKVITFDNTGLAEFTNISELPKNTAFHEVFNFEGLTAGLYNIEASISGVRLAFNTLDATHLKVTLDGVAFDSTSAKLRTGELFYNGHEPLVLEVWGITDGSLGTSSYSGQISVTAVPEPETYAMLLGGLGLLGVVARRRKANKQA